MHAWMDKNTYTNGVENGKIHTIDPNLNLPHVPQIKWKNIYIYIYNVRRRKSLWMKTRLLQEREQVHLFIYIREKIGRRGFVEGGKEWGSLNAHHHRWFRENSWESCDFSSSSSFFFYLKNKKTIILVTFSRIWRLESVKLNGNFTIFSLVFISNENY